jgi:hypothetical protein
MPDCTLDPVGRVAGTATTRAFGPVPPGEQWSVAIRAVNVGTTDSIVDVFMCKADGSNINWRAKSQDVFLRSAFDVDTCLTMPPGYELRDRSGNNDVSVSYTGTKLPIA